MCGGGGGGVSGVVNAISSAVSSIGSAVGGVGKALENITKNPLPVIMTVALTAAVVATAGAAAPAAFALEAGFIAAPIAAGLGGGTLATMAGVAIQQAVIGAAVAALNGGSISQIGTAALQSGVTAGITYGATTGLPGSISSATGMSAELGKIAAGAIGGAAGAAASAAITGKPIDTAALVGGVAGGTGAALGTYLPKTELGQALGTTGVKMLTTAGAAASGAIAGGKNAGYAATMAAVTVGLSTALSNFQSSQKEVQDVVSKNPDLINAAAAAGDAAQTLKNTPPEVIEQLKTISDVQGAASRIASQVTAAMYATQDGHYYQSNSISWDAKDLATLKATGAFDAEVALLDELGTRQQKAYEYNIARGMSPTEAKMLANMTDWFQGTEGVGMSGGHTPQEVAALGNNLLNGANSYVKTITAMTPQIQAYVDAQQVLKDNTAILDAATGGKYSEYRNSTEKLLSGVEDYGQYSTQVNNGTLTSTPQEDALNEQVKQQLNVLNASWNSIKDLDPASQEYADGFKQYQANGEKLTNLSAQSAALTNYFKGNSAPVNGTDVSDVIRKNGGDIGFANSVSSYYTDNGAISPVPTALDGNGNVILSTKDYNGNLTGVYSIGTNGSQVATVDQLKTLALSGDSAAIGFANQASMFLTGSQLPPLTPEDKLIGTVEVTNPDGSKKYWNAAANKYYNADGTESTASANTGAQITPPPGAVTTPTTVPSTVEPTTPSLAENVKGAVENAPGTIGQVASTLNPISTAQAATPPATTATLVPGFFKNGEEYYINDKGVEVPTNRIYAALPEGEAPLTGPTGYMYNPTTGEPVETQDKNPYQVVLPIDPNIQQPTNVATGTTPTNVTTTQPTTQTGGAATVPTTSETATTGGAKTPTDSAVGATNTINAIDAINNTPSTTTTPSTATTGGVSPVPTPTTGGGTSTTAAPTEDTTVGGKTTGAVDTGTVGGNQTATGGTGAGVGTGTGAGAGGTGTGTGSGATAAGVGAGIGLGLGLTSGTTGTTGTTGTRATTGSAATDTTGGIQNLTPGLTTRMDYTLSGLPVIHEEMNPVEGEVQKMATGGQPAAYDPFSTDSTIGKSGLTPGLTKAQINYILTGLPSHALGGSISSDPQPIEHPPVPSHNPEFYSEGGLSSAHRYVKGDGDGTSDSVPAMLANGEFVIPADVVSSLGNGSNDAGASVLDQFLKTIREHKQAHDAKHLPPDSKGPLSYLTDAKRKAKVKA